VQAPTWSWRLAAALALSVAVFMAMMAPFAIAAVVALAVPGALIAVLVIAGVLSLAGSLLVMVRSSILPAVVATEPVERRRLSSFLRRTWLLGKRQSTSWLSAPAVRMGTVVTIGAAGGFGAQMMAAMPRALIARIIGLGPVSTLTDLPIVAAVVCSILESVPHAVVLLWVSALLYELTLDLRVRRGESLP
jgi:hypothetical protein